MKSDEETAETYDWSDFTRLLRERDGRTITGWCRVHGFSYGSVCNLIYGIWSSRQGYGPVARRIIGKALEEGLIRPCPPAILPPAPASESSAQGGR